MLPEGYPQIECAAEIAGVRTGTLQRMLARDGVTYRELVDRARFDAASRSLREPSTKITDIAFDLGYTDAFRRWAGASPSGYRRDCLATLSTQPPRAAP